MADEPQSTDPEPAPAAEDETKTTADLAEKAMEMLNGGLVVTLPEPAQRSRSYRELILQEMNWMACDYYHERRWKVHAGKQICIGIKDSALDRKKLNKNWIASECTLHMKRFWAGIIANAQHHAIVSDELAEYCASIANKYNDHLHTDTGDVTRDYDVGERDIIAITVPVVKLKEGNSAIVKTRTQKNEVLEATILSMQSMGADFYRPLFRPPDDEMDMFTMPLMDPARDNDFNALLVQSFCLKHCDRPRALLRTKSEVKPAQLPEVTRKFARQTNEPSCLAMSVRDFDLQVKPKPTFSGTMVKTQLTAIDFELLDSWMLSDAPSWPMLAICLTYRSSASGLHRHEYGTEYCRDVFLQLSRQPRGLVNSSRRLLGPRQRNAITTFLDTPPRRLKFEPLVDCDNQNGSNEQHAAISRLGLHGPHNYGRRKSYIDPVSRKRKRRRSLKALYLALLQIDNTGEKSVISRSRADDGTIVIDGESESTKVKAAPAATNAHGKRKKRQRKQSIEVVEQEGANGPQIHLPFSSSAVKDVGELSVLFLQRSIEATHPEPAGETSQSQTTLFQGVDKDDAKGEIIALPKNARIEVAITSGNKMIPRCHKSDREIEPMLHMPNVPYGEYSNRMSKQLRVGFLGIPAKMFAHSLFYSGRFCKNNRVRRVSVTIASATKIMMPQPNMLYARLFEHDVVEIFGRFRTHNWQRTLDHPPDRHGEQLLKKYSTELTNSPSKKLKPTADMRAIEILAGYVTMKLSRGEGKQQGALGTNKILVKSIEQVDPIALQQQLPHLHHAPAPQQQPQQHVYMPPMQNMQMQGHGVSPHGAGQPMMMHPVMPPPMKMAPMQNPQMAHMPMHHGSMSQGGRTPGSATPGSMTPVPNGAGQMVPPPMQQGHMTPGSLTPRQMALMKMPPGPMAAGGMQPGQMTPGGMQPGQMTPGSMTPGQMAPGKIPPGTMPGMPPMQQQMQSKAAAMQMHMEQMKRRPPMPMPGKRRPMMAYEQMYQPQVAPPPYRYRPMPDVNMMRMPMYPVAMYNKQIPYPKTHDDQYRSPHMQR
ncbi:HSA family protein [Babesia ovata]|uniref:HSA family protein n=1 Tax=Babesia ovata TaxID=189622 RepID=A0A2H6KCH4_9APIC|nr:HSA family protein [Babesia ovata]GBE60659.1 HSA family protein [Babesia ovata]